MGITFKNTLNNTWRLVTYNLKIVFGGKFWLFVLSALLFFLIFGTVQAFNDDYFTQDEIYGLLLLPSLLLIFYPTVFGIQNDADMRTLEIIFGIPDYRYKVWFVRLIMVFLIVFALLFPLAYLARVLLIDFDYIPMILQLMVVVLFVGNLAFFLSTWIKNGNATAVVVVLIGLIYFIMQGVLRDSMWNIFLNPFRQLEGTAALLWEETVMYNRIFMLSASVIFILFGLLNLQRREKFLR
ncbi:hypothetical protein ACE01N_13200 [Saccharicrinis sp. FJH2]|uniref:hypothetical protein n=1 Tax=Saccharicrinis sp. FJH65 TaxID=3344659 RepID=UPI0035F32FEB